MKANTKAVLDYVVANDGKDFTAKDIAADLGLTPRQVNGIITAAFCRYKDVDKNIVPLMERVEKEIELSDGTHEKVKFIKLTEAGRNLDPEADEKAKAAAKDAE